MTDAEVGRQILRLTACLMGGFAVVVAVVSLVGRLRGKSPWELLVKYAAWFLMIPAILIPLVSGRLAFQVAVCLISIQCMREFCRACGLWSDRRFTALCYLLVVVTYVAVITEADQIYAAVPVLTLGVLLLVPLARNQYAQMIQKVCLGTLGVLYFGWFLSHLAYLRSVPHGLKWVFFLMVLAECNDACAYLWGGFLGRHKLCTRISPNKTVEGAVGGMLSVVLLGWLMRGLSPVDGFLGIVLLGLMISVLGICGDLVVSFIKRDLGVKDMGALIPGHGGLLDRVDSLVLGAPVFFHLVKLWQA
jgi:phosphatidate cytidylyltransferase